MSECSSTLEVRKCRLLVRIQANRDAKRETRANCMTLWHSPTDKGQSVPFAHRLYIVGVPGLIWVSARPAGTEKGTAPHGVGGQCADMYLERFALFNIQLRDSQFCAPYSVASEVILSFTKSYSRLRHGYPGPWSTSWSNCNYIPYISMDCSMLEMLCEALHDKIVQN